MRQDEDAPSAEWKALNRLHQAVLGVARAGFDAPITSANHGYWTELDAAQKQARSALGIAKDPIPSIKTGRQS